MIVRLRRDLWNDPPMLARTLLRLNSHHPEVRTDTRDLYRMHRRVSTLLGGVLPLEGEPRLLWAHPRPDRLLIQHPTRLDLRWLPDGYLISSKSEPVHLPSAGDPIRWATMANPTKECTCGLPPPAGYPTWSPWVHEHPETRQRPVTRRTPIDSEHGVREYMTRRLAGLDITTMTIVDRVTRTGWKPGHKITITGVHLTGTGLVVDASAVGDVLVGGFGKARAYGYGLLVCEIAR